MRPEAKPQYNETNFFIMAYFCMYVIIWFLQIGERVDVLAGLRFELISAAGLLFLSIFTIFSGLNTTKKSTGLALYLALFIVTVVLGVIFSMDPELSWQIFYARLVKFSCMAVFIVAFVRSPRDLRLFFLAFCLACLYITQESFRAALDGSMVWQNQGVPRLHGDTSLFRHPNSLGGLATGALPFFWFLFPRTKTTVVKLMLLALALTASGCVMYSGSRTAYLGLIFFGLHALYHSKKKGTLVLIAIIGLSVGIPLLPKEYKARFTSIFTGKEIEGASMSTRRVILEDAWKVCKTYPLGVGVAAFPEVRENMFGRKQDTHNLYLEVLTNIGIQGFIAFGLFIFHMLLTFGTTRKSIRQQLERLQGMDDDPEVKKHKEDLELLDAGCLAASGYIWVRLVLGFFGMDLYEIYWWVGFGLAIALYRMTQTAEDITDSLLSSETDAEVA